MNAFKTVGLLVVVSVAYKLLFRKKPLGKLPPGPKPWPLVGNVTDLPPKGMPEYQHWRHHLEAYGPISSVTAMGQTLVILHDREAVHELMETRSAKTSSRPWFEYASNLCGFANFLSLKSYDEAFREQRKLVHQQLGTRKAVAQYNDVQVAETGRFLRSLLDAPAGLSEHINTEAGATILKIAYGYTIEPEKEDPLVRLIDDMMKISIEVLQPLAQPVDLFPILGRLPEWFPGASFIAKAKKATLINQAVVDVPYTFVEDNMANRSHTPSIVSRLIDQMADDDHKLSPHAEHTIKWSAGVLYAGASDTMVASMESFVLAMLQFPNVQKKAQEEIDSITGGERLPSFEDRERLPYIEGVLKEALRWFPVAPMGFAHVVDEDIIFKGHLIPKGAILLPALKYLLHDPTVYSDPTSFDPSRYAEPRNEADPGPLAFGFGRRVCPGRQLADSNLFVIIAQMLAAFDIVKALDEQGREIEPQVASTPGVIDHPAAFPFRIVARSDKHAQLVRQTAVEFPPGSGDASSLASAPFQSISSMNG